MSSPLKDVTHTRDIATVTAADVRRDLIENREIALLDVREEAIHAQGHPLFAANLALSRLEVEAHARLPRLDVPIVLFGEQESDAVLAAERLARLGYTEISLLESGLAGWRDAGFEVFRDVNSPSKAFGELVEAALHTPSLSALEVDALIRNNADILIVDARRYEEFRTMSIPTAHSAPGAELVYRLRGVARRPTTTVIVNCGGRTRSIIGAQSLIHAGLLNPVRSLRNGTIGWKLAHLELDRGAFRSLPTPSAHERELAAEVARRVADQAGVRRTTLDEALRWRAEGERTVYLFDVRTPEEYAEGTLPRFLGAPGGQLVQETDMFAPVRGARLVLADDDGARANMTASWLTQMNWEVYVVDGLRTAGFARLPPQLEVSAPPVADDAPIAATVLHAWLKSSSRDKIAVLDFSRARQYRAQHIPGSHYALRSRLDKVLQTRRDADIYVVTAHDSLLARYTWRDLAAKTHKPVYLLAGGNAAWKSAGYHLDDDAPSFASQPLDEYERPYEGTNASAESMQAYLDWEHGLVEQLARDGTHGFWVLETK